MPEIFDCRDVKCNFPSLSTWRILWPGVTKNFISDNNNNTSQMAHGPARLPDYGIYLTSSPFSLSLCLSSLTPCICSVHLKATSS